MKILDIGNTRIKCYEVKSINSIDVVFDISAKKQTLECYIENCKEEIYAISTNKEFEDFITIKKLRKINTSLFEKLTDFKIPYEGYGIDRLINSYAASKLYSNNVLVVSMGSAITYDIVKNSKIEYGYITPGLTQRKESLSISVPHLKMPTNKLGKARNFKKPSNTQEAIAYGIAKELLSTINTIKSEENVEVVITGGDADFFEDIFTIDKLLTPKGIFLSFKK